MPLRPSTGFVGADPAVTTPRGFDIVPTLSTRRQWFPCGPLPARHLTWFSPGLFLLRSLPWLLTTAAGGGLEPAPASRFRGASPHRWHSCALQRLFQPSSCSWRTSSSAGESHPRALTEPDVNLAAHPALMVQPSWTALPWSCTPPITGGSMSKAEPFNPFAPGPLQTLRHSYWLIRPCASHRYSGPCGASTWAAPFASRRQVPRLHT